MSKITDYMIEHGFTYNDEGKLMIEGRYELRLLVFKQAEYNYICARADRGFQYDYADESRSIEGKVYWKLINSEGRFLAYVHKHNGTVHETLYGLSAPKDA